MKIKDLELYFEEELDEDIDIDYDLFEEDEEYRIYLENRYLFIPDLNIDVYSGYYAVYDEDTEEFEIDFDFYMFFDSDTNKHLYEEQGSGLEVCIYNYCRFAELDVNDIDDIYNLKCEIVLK